MPDGGAVDSELLVERRGAALWCIFNRPRAMNAVTPAVVTAMEQALDLIANEPGIRCLIITGKGRAFCAGANLNAVGSPDTATSEIDAFIDSINTLLLRITRLEIPVVAAINGTAAGAGLEFALCADFIVARAGASIGDGHSRFGLLPGGGASVRLPRRIGLAAAKWLSFTGALHPAQDLLTCGLVQCVYPADSFDHDVRELIETITSRSPLGLRIVKELIDKSLERDVPDALAAEQEQLKTYRSSYDRAEGMAAFRAKRQPVFRGI